ncbi:MAG: hypothetical protein FRX48_03094 [Lasallia pustulata]|uniref:Rhodopsin domain-containing protein n=1 Tax=Lasallia pustulata TaxID=136370 RepID=A0A5M8PUN2_9LECA|nr:MAG: hypothetical protein FRX48_03094 [Lasallia pustulata]
MANLLTKLCVPYATPGATYAVSITLPGLSIIFVLLRFYTRSLQKNAFGIDDWLMLPALATVTAMGITLVIGTHLKAFAYPTSTMSLTQIIRYPFLYFMILSYGFIKLSISFFYRRLFVSSRGAWFDWATKISIAVVILWIISFFFGYMFSCGTHISARWISFEDNAKYYGALPDLNSAFVVSDLITDIMILCLPLPVIWNLHMTTGRKLVVTGILATGAVSIGAAIIKVIPAFELTNGDLTHGGLTAHVDPELSVTIILFWSMIEAGLGAIAACLPTLHPLLGKISLDSIVNSVRSALCLDSLHWQRSQRPVSHREGSHTNPTPQIHRPRGSQWDVTQVKESGIYVTSQIWQHESMV